MGSTVAAQRHEPGAILAGRYEIDRVLRAERTGMWYLVVDREGGRGTLALQAWPARFAGAAERADALKSLTMHAERLQRGQIPGLCAVRALETQQAPREECYLLIEHTPGLTIEEEWEEAGGTLSWRVITEWAIGLCETLQALHALQPAYVLGTLHPATVRIAAGAGRPVIVDPGLRRRLDFPAGEYPGFLPLEQILGREEPRSDLYALGAVLHRLLGGHDPDIEYARLRRTGMDVQRALRALFPPLNARALGIPQVLADAVLHCTAFSVEDRFEDANALRQTLLAVHGPVAPVDVEPLPEPSADPAWKQLGLTHEQWFALPARERNRRLLELVRHDRP